MSTTLDEQLISQKIHNYNYAPGIATYGVAGKTGEDGVSGNNIYYTDYYINNNDTTSHDLSGIAAQIVAGHLPLKNSTISISRPYANGDYFFDNFGTIFKLKNIDAMKSTSEMSNYQIYFDIVGTISIKDDGYVTYSGDRLIINSSTYNGFDIVSAEGLTDNINQNAVMNIISNTVDKNNRVQLLQLNSVDSNSLEDGTSLVYYDAGDNAFHLESNIPIVIDADLKINNDNANKEYDNYSTILTSHDSITYFKSLCDKLTYKIEENNDGNYYMMIYAKDYESLDASGADILKELVNKGVYAKVYGENGAQKFVKFDSYDTLITSINSQQILDLSLCTCNYWDPDLRNYFEPYDPYDEAYSYDVSIKFKNIDASNYIQVNIDEAVVKYVYKGKRQITYKQDNETITKEAYIYSQDDAQRKRSTNLAIFNPYLLIYCGQYLPLYYWRDYIVYQTLYQEWNTNNFNIKETDIFLDNKGKVRLRYVSQPTQLINNGMYLQIGTKSYYGMVDTKNITDMKYRNSTWDIVYLNQQTYTESGDYTYKFTYHEAPEINEIETNKEWGSYKHSLSTDFLNIQICNFLYFNNNTIYNIISLRNYLLKYIKAFDGNIQDFYCSGKGNRTYNKETVINEYPQFIDGEEYEFSFSLYIGDDGLRLTNCKLFGKLKNNADATIIQIPMFKTMIPKEIGTAAKVSLMHNSEIFLSHE